MFQIKAGQSVDKSPLGGCSVERVKAGDKAGEAQGDLLIGGYMLPVGSTSDDTIYLDKEGSEWKISYVKGLQECSRVPSAYGRLLGQGKQAQR
jgi:hypothetical protein